MKGNSVKRNLKKIEINMRCYLNRDFVHNPIFSNSGHLLGTPIVTKIILVLLKKLTKKFPSNFQNTKGNFSSVYTNSECQKHDFLLL